MVIIADAPNGSTNAVHRSMKAAKRSDLPVGYSSFMNCVTIDGLIVPNRMF
jgi:hypothetical protein